MGTAKQWIEVAVVGFVFAAGMLLVNMFRGDNVGQSARAHILSTIAAMIVLGFWYGFLVAFGWQVAVHRPLLYLVIPAFAATVLAGRLYRQRLKSQAKPSTTPN